MADYLSADVEETTVDVNKMAKSLNTWLGFELILTLVGFCYIVYLYIFENLPPQLNMTILVTSIVMIIRTILIFRAWVDSIVGEYRRSKI